MRQLHAFDGLVAGSLSLGECLVSTAGRVQDDLFLCDSIHDWFHRVHAGHVLLGADLPGCDERLLLDLRLDRLLTSLILSAVTLEVLTDVKGRGPEAISVLPFCGRFLTRASWRGYELLNRSVTQNSALRPAQPKANAKERHLPGSATAGRY